MFVQGRKNTLQVIYSAIINECFLFIFLVFGFASVWLTMDKNCMELEEVHLSFFF